MTNPFVARPKPSLVTLKSRRRYFRRSCARSANQALSDGSFRGTRLAPLRYAVIPESGAALFCGCKHTYNAPVRDGAHTSLPRKRFPSLEATCAGGIDVVGVTCPGDKPHFNNYD
jgi:hypothetical protein